MYNFGTGSRYDFFMALIVLITSKANKGQCHFEEFDSM